MIDNTPRIYVGTYAKYNNGSIAGQWLDMDAYSDKDEFYAACAELHADESDPEFMFQDHENIPDNLISESGLDDEFWPWLELDEDDREMLSAFWDCYGSGTIEQARDSVQGKYDSKKDFAEEMADQCMEIPDSIANYFDYDSFARDLFFDYTYHDDTGFVFCDNF